jgi:branched-chain amino acid transport system substrate-binding protein
MHRKRLIRLASVATVACLGAALVAAPASAQSGSGNKNGTLVLGSLAPETGDLSAIVDSLRVPVTIAVDEINAAGGVNGKQVTLVTGDDGTDPEVAAQTIDRMISSDGTDVIIGPASSGTALGILGKVKGKAVLCSGSNTAAQLDKDGPKKTGGLYFRTAPTDALQGPALAELILSDGHSKVAILTRNDSYGVGFGKATAKALKQGGANVVTNVAYKADGDNFDADVQKVLDKKPDAVVVLGFNDDGAKIVQTMIEKGAGPADVPIYTADGMQSSKFGETVDPANPGVVSGMKGTAPAAAPDGVESPFQATFAATGTDPIFSSYYYDCTILSALAAVKAKSDAATDIAKAFRANVTGKEDCNTFATCKDLLESGKTIHWRGASSNFDKFPKNQPNQGVYDVWSYDGSAKVVTEDPSSQIQIG